MSNPLLLSYYGDDLTGSTDAMEALAVNGVKTVLFTHVPDAARRAKFADYAAVGLAGTSRSETPQWMDTHLRAAFDWLASLKAPMCHYKVCSTFDSSPGTGNIGRAIEIGRAAFGQTVTPLIVGVPQLRRFTCFGQLFAAYQGVVYRIDRHPVMSRHPVTPMTEADLALHLAKQTDLPVKVLSFEALQKDSAADDYKAMAAAGPGILLVDVTDMATQAKAGEIAWRFKGETGPFIAGSSGVEYALFRAWAKTGEAKDAPSFAAPGPAERIAVVSGSVSPSTERQIRIALDNGFTGIAVDAIRLLGGEAKAEMERAIAEGLTQLSAGRSVILHTALGPATDRGAEIAAKGASRHMIGKALGGILSGLVERAKLSRVVVAGGDTSSHALSALGIDALTTCHPLPKTPGSPLCTAHGNAMFDGLQIAFKGGQLGGDDYFVAIRDGRMG